MRRSRGCLLAALLFACAGPAPRPEAPAAASASPSEPAPPSAERRRFEAWKQAGESADPRAAFAREAEAEAARRRRDALAEGSGIEAASIEREMVRDELVLLGAGGTGCLAEEPDLASQDDWIRHRTLSRGDFLAPEASEDAKAVAWIPFGEIGAHVAVRLACIVEGRLREPEPGQFVVEIAEVRYMALLSRRLSWWNPRADGTQDWVLRHEQLHFDVAELVAKELTSKAEALHAELVGHGPDPSAAMADFRRQWVVHIREQQERFVEIEHRYDRETRHGTDLERQTEWFALVRRGLGAVRAGLPEAPVLVR
jgi:hypothetical protein